MKEVLLTDMGWEGAVGTQESSVHSLPPAGFVLHGKSLNMLLGPGACADSKNILESSPEMGPFWLATKWAEEISNLPKGSEPASFREKGWTVVLYPRAQKQAGCCVGYGQNTLGQYLQHHCCPSARARGPPPHSMHPLNPSGGLRAMVRAGHSPHHSKDCSYSLVGKSHPMHRAQVWAERTWCGLHPSSLFPVGTNQFWRICSGWFHSPPPLSLWRHKQKDPQVKRWVPCITHQTPTGYLFYIW